MLYPFSFEKGLPLFRVIIVSISVIVLENITHIGVIGFHHSSSLRCVTPHARSDRRYVDKEKAIGCCRRSFHHSFGIALITSTKHPIPVSLAGGQASDVLNRSRRHHSSCLKQHIVLSYTVMFNVRSKIDNAREQSEKSTRPHIWYAKVLTDKKCMTYFSAIGKLHYQPSEGYLRECQMSYLTNRFVVSNQTRNSSGDEIANVNFLYDDIVHALKIQ